MKNSTLTTSSVQSPVNVSITAFTTRRRFGGYAGDAISRHPPCPTRTKQCYPFPCGSQQSRLHSYRFHNLHCEACRMNWSSAPLPETTLANRFQQRIHPCPTCTSPGKHPSRRHRGRRGVLPVGNIFVDPEIWLCVFDDAFAPALIFDAPYIICSSSFKTLD